MTGVFLRLLNISISASWLVVAVFLMRLCLKKAPKWSYCLLWAVVALRLLLPFFPESSLSLIPSAEVIPENITEAPVIHSGISAVNDAVNPILQNVSMDSNPLQHILSTGSLIWLVGVGVMVLYSTATYLWLRWTVRIRIPTDAGIYICDNVHSPFILGTIRPSIYLPSGLTQDQLPHVIAHEKAHIHRMDHWWKPLGFLLLSVYWFNPLLWVCYILLCRDIEQACDEKVIKEMDNHAKRAYSEALVSCSTRRRMILVCPLAFGEVAVKDRIKAVLHYKKPTLWIIVATVVICVVVSVCFLTNPAPCVHHYQSRITLETTCTHAGENTYTCTDCWDSYTEPIPMLAHTYTDGSITKAPTCTETGTQEFTCTGCGSVRTEEIALLSHSFGACSMTKAPTCTQTGEMSATCSICSQTHVVELLQPNDVHTMVNTVVRDSTCSDPGEGINTCTECGKTEAVTYELKSHHYTNGMTLPATCMQEGSQQMLCSCGAEKWLTIPKTNEHHWIDGGLYFPDFCMCGAQRHDYEEGANAEVPLIGGGSSPIYAEDLFNIIKQEP